MVGEGWKFVANDANQWFGRLERIWNGWTQSWCQVFGVLQVKGVVLDGGCGALMCCNSGGTSRGIEATGFGSCFGGRRSVAGDSIGGVVEAEAAHADY